MDFGAALTAAESDLGPTSIRPGAAPVAGRDHGDRGPKSPGSQLTSVGRITAARDAG